jgi:Flp pilus assembly protein TadG
MICRLKTPLSYHPTSDNASSDAVTKPMMSQRSPSQSFQASAGGNVAAAFALMAPVLFLFAGLAIDYSTAIKISATLQTDVDAAALSAAAHLGSEDAAVEQGTTYLDAALASHGFAAGANNIKIKRDSGTDDFVAAVSYKMKTKFAGAFGFDTFDIEVKSSAAPKSGTRVLDIAMCLDATGSMQPTLDAVKTNALNFYNTLNQELQNRQLQKFDAVKIRPIYFRDFGGNWKWYDFASGGQVDKFPNGFVSRPAGDAKNYGDDVPLRSAADFYNVFDKQADLVNFVQPEIESGGGDYTESGIECLNEAMDSKWTRIGDKIKTPNGDKDATDVFSIIAIWTDQDAHAPSFSYSLLNPNYPDATKMPRDYAGLRAKWDNEAKIPQTNKLLATFMPAGAPTSGWDPIFAWPRYMAAGTLTGGTNQMVSSIADAVSTVVAKSGSVRLTQ